MSNTAHFRWAYAAVASLAVKLLEDDNKTCGENWPAGQSWQSLGGSSKAVYLRQARELAGIPHDQFLAVVRAHESLIEDIYWIGKLPIEQKAASPIAQTGGDSPRAPLASGRTFDDNQ